MKIKLFKLLFLGFLANISILSYALDPAELKLITDAVKKVTSKIDISQSTVTTISEWYQITSGTDVLYLSKDGRYFFHGDLIDLNEKDQNKRNLTDVTKKLAVKTELNKYSDKDMIVYKPSKNNHIPKLGTITIFADISCPFSRRLHKEVEEAVDSGLEARYLFFPRGGIGSDSYNKAVSVWCAKNRKKEFSLANKEESITERTCKNNPVEQQFNLGLKIGINATPTIVLEHGTVIPGYVTAEHLLKLVQEENARSSS